MAEKKPLVINASGGVEELQSGDTLIASPVSARIYHDTTVSIADNTVTVLAFNQELWDTHAFHSGLVNNTRLTIPITGLYHVTFNARFAGHAATTTRQLLIRRNGIATFEAITRVASIAGDGSDFCLCVDVLLTAGDYLEFLVYQNSGAALNCNAVTVGMAPSASIFLIK